MKYRILNHNSNVSYAPTGSAIRENNADQFAVEIGLKDQLVTALQKMLDSGRMNGQESNFKEERRVA